MIDEHVSRVFKSSNEQTPQVLSLSPPQFTTNHDYNQFNFNNKQQSNLILFNQQQSNNYHNSGVGGGLMHVVGVQCCTSATSASTHSDKQSSSVISSNKHGSNLGDNNYDSGVSLRTTASFERVHDWLAVNATHNNSNLQLSSNNNNTNFISPTITLPPQTQQHLVQFNQQQQSIKTTVAYSLPGEDCPFVSTFNGRELTLAQFKQLITKRGNFR